MIDADEPRSWPDDLVAARNECWRWLLFAPLAEPPPAACAEYDRRMAELKRIGSRPTVSGRIDR